MERTPTKTQWPRDTAKQQTSRVGERHRGWCMCVLPYLHYLCVGVRDEVLLVGVYDSHLDQSIGLPVSAWGHQITTCYREREREGESMKGVQDGENRRQEESKEEKKRTKIKMRGGDNPLR